jgi:hypothetical protein
MLALTNVQGLILGEAIEEKSNLAKAASPQVHRTLQQFTDLERDPRL